MSEKGFQALSRKEALPIFKGTQLTPSVDCLADKNIQFPFLCCPCPENFMSWIACKHMHMVK